MARWISLYLRVETIKDLRSQDMPRHEDQNPTLREMDTLLEEMNQLNAGHTPDHMPDGLGWNLYQKAKNAVHGTNLKEKWTKGDVAGKRATIQQALCELTQESGGWPEASLDSLRLSLQANRKRKKSMALGENV